MYMKYINLFILKKNSTNKNSFKIFKILILIDIDMSIILFFFICIINYLIRPNLAFIASILIIRILLLILYF